MAGKKTMTFVYKPLRLSVIYVCIYCTPFHSVFSYTAIN